MKKQIKLLIAILCLAITAATLASCSAVKIDRELEIKISVLNGTTGFGAAKLWNDADEGNTELNYKFNVDTAPANIQAGLI